MGGPGCASCRLLRAGGQDELLLLGLLLSSSSVLLSGLDAASLSSWTSELLCSVSSHIHRLCVCVCVFYETPSGRTWVAVPWGKGQRSASLSWPETLRLWRRVAVGQEKDVLDRWRVKGHTSIQQEMTSEGCRSCRKAAFRVLKESLFCCCSLDCGRCGWVTR